MGFSPEISDTEDAYQSQKISKIIDLYHEATDNEPTMIVNLSWWEKTRDFGYNILVAGLGPPVVDEREWNRQLKIVSIVGICLTGVGIYLLKRQFDRNSK
jgi:hypothetical protein